jgi:hypothetical protein
MNHLKEKKNREGRQSSDIQNVKQDLDRFTIVTFDSDLSDFGSQGESDSSGGIEIDEVDEENAW